MSEERATTTKHVLTSSFNGFEQQRDETNKWPFNLNPAANAKRADNEPARRIKWPTDLNSLGIDSDEAFRPNSRLTLPFQFPVHESPSSPSAIHSAFASTHPSNMEQTTMVTMNSAISGENHNPNDTFNETVNIVSHVIDIIANTSSSANNVSSMESAAAAVTEMAPQAIPNGFRPEIYIDENGIFRIKYVRRACDGRNNGTDSIEIFSANAISPIANNGSEQHTETTSSINSEIDETAINSYDDQQYDLDVRFDGPNGSVMNSNRDNDSSASTTGFSTPASDNDINVNAEKSSVNSSTILA